MVLGNVLSLKQEASALIVCLGFPTNESFHLDGDVSHGCESPLHQDVVTQARFSSPRTDPAFHLTLSTLSIGTTFDC